MEEEGKRLEAILDVAAKEIVYRQISQKLTPINTKFQELRRKYKVESDLSWLEIENELDEHTRVKNLFQDAWNKDLLIILGEALYVEMKKIYDMFGDLLPFPHTVSANKQKQIPLDIKAKAIPQAELEEPIKSMIEEGKELFRLLNEIVLSQLENYVEKCFEILRKLCSTGFPDFDVPIWENAYELCLLAIKIQRYSFAKIPPQENGQSQYDLFLSCSLETSFACDLKSNLNFSSVQRVLHADCIVYEDARRAIMCCGSACILLESQWQETEECALQFLLLISRKRHECEISKGSLGEIHPEMDRPDYRFQLFVYYTTDGLPKSIQKVLNGANVTSDQETMKEILKSHVTEVHQWIFAIFPPETKETNIIHNTERCVGIASISFLENNLVTIHDTQFPHPWKGKLDENSWAQEFERNSDEETDQDKKSLSFSQIHKNGWKIRISNGVVLDFCLKKPSVIEGYLRIGESEYKVYASKSAFTFDSSKSNLKEKEKKSIIQIIHDHGAIVEKKFSIIDIQEFANAKYKALVHVSGIETDVESYFLNSVEFAKLGDKVQYCLHRFENPISNSEIEECMVISWFEDNLDPQSPFLEFEKVSPEVLLEIDCNPGEKLEITAAKRLECDESKKFVECISSEKFVDKCKENIKEGIFGPVKLKKVKKSVLYWMEVQKRIYWNLKYNHSIDTNLLSTLISSSIWGLDKCSLSRKAARVFSNTCKAVGLVQLSNHLGNNSRDKHFGTINLPVKGGCTIFYLEDVEDCNLDENGSQKNLINRIESCYGIQVSSISWVDLSSRYEPSQVVKARVERQNSKNPTAGGFVYNDKIFNLIKYLDGTPSNHELKADLVRMCLATLEKLKSWESLGEKTPLIGNTFISLRFGDRSEATGNSNLSNDPNASGDMPRKCKVQDLLSLKEPILIIGHAGQGKTTLLRRLCYLVPVLMFSKNLLPFNQFLENLKKFPASFINGLRIKVEQAGYPCNAVGLDDLEAMQTIFKDLGKKPHKMDELRALMWILLVDECVRILKPKAQFECPDAIEAFHKFKESFGDDEYLKTVFENSTDSQKFVHLDTLELQNLRSERDCWLLATIFTESFCCKTINAHSKITIALLVRADQLWEFEKQNSMETTDRSELFKFLLWFHLKNLKLNDMNDHDIEDLVKSFSDLVFSPNIKKLLMLDAVDEISIEERSSDQFQKWITNITKFMGRDNVFSNIIVTGRYSCVQPIPENYKTVIIRSLSKKKATKYLDALFCHWKNLAPPVYPATDTITAKGTIDHMNRMKIESSPLLLLLFAIAGYKKEFNFDSSSLFDVYEWLIKSMYNRTKENHPLILPGFDSSVVDEWALDMFSLFGFILHYVGSLKGVTVLQLFDVAFLFEQFRAEGFLWPANSPPQMSTQFEPAHCMEERIALWCITTLGIVSTASRNPNDKMDDIIQFQHRTFQEFLAARALTKYKDYSQDGVDVQKYPLLSKISIIGDFDWSEDNFVCSDWWDVVRKFIVSKEGLEFLAKKIVPFNSDKQGKSHIEIWANSIIKSGGVDYTDLGHVRLATLLSWLPYDTANDKLESLLGQVLISIGNSNAEPMCSILENSVGICKDSSGDYKIDENAHNMEYLRNICERVFKGLNYESFSQILTLETLSTFAAKSIKEIFGNYNNLENDQEMLKFSNSESIIRDTTRSSSSAIPENEKKDDTKVGSSKLSNDRITANTRLKRSDNLIGKSSRELCDLLADEQLTAINLHKDIWEMKGFIPSIKELSSYVFKRFPVSEALNVLSPCGIAVYLFYRHLKQGERDNFGKQLNNKETIEKFQKIFEKHWEIWPEEFIEKILDWNVVLNGNWYPWIEYILEHSSNARNLCGKVVITLNTSRLLFCQPFFMHLSKIWRRFIKKTESLIDADPLPRQDEIKHESPLPDEYAMMELLSKIETLENPNSHGFGKYDALLWKFSCLLVPGEPEVREQEEKFNQLFTILSNEVTVALQRAQESEFIPSEIPFKVTHFIGGSFANATTLRLREVISDMEVIMILNDKHPCLKRKFEHGTDLVINNTPVLHGTRESIREALLEAIEQTSQYPEFTGCEFNGMNQNRHRYTLQSENWECDILPALKTGGGLYYFLNCSEEEELLANKYSVEEFKMLSDSRKGLRDVVRCLKLAKQNWEGPNHIPSCLFEVAVSAVAKSIGEKAWNLKSFAAIWKESWEYILDKVRKNEPIPRPNNPRSDLILELKENPEKFIGFSRKMIATDAKKILYMLMDQYLRIMENVLNPFIPIPPPLPPVSLAEKMDKDRNTPLHIASINGNTEWTRQLIDKGADLNKKNKNGYTPLHFASKNGHELVAQLLIENRADIDKKTDFGDTPLNIASRYQQIEVVKLLIDKRANLHEKNGAGKIPLHYTSDVALARLLIDGRANIQERAKDGETPLHTAAKFGNSRVVLLLIDKKALVDKADNNGFTPLHYARQKRHQETVKLLTENSTAIK